MGGSGRGATRPEAISIENLHKSFGQLEVLKGVSLRAHEGDVVAIIGGSGSGKSTMLRCINFLETPTSGKIYIGGEQVAMKVSLSCCWARTPPRADGDAVIVSTGLSRRQLLMPGRDSQSSAFFSTPLMP